MLRLEPADVNGCSGQNAGTRQKLQHSGNEESAALLQREQLADEGEECAAAEDHRQDHQGLHRLNPLCIFVLVIYVIALPFFFINMARIPQICDVALRNPP